MYRFFTLALLAICACAGPTAPEGLPERSPTVVGPIVARDTPLSSMGDKPNVHIRPVMEECGTVFAIDAQTTIVVREANGRLRQGGVDDLMIGRMARAWARGVILESCPGQTTAEAIELLE